MEVPVGNEVVVVRDQERLKEGHVLLPPTWKISDLCLYLDSHVYFWPGTKNKPIQRGLDFGERYYGREEVVVLRIPMEDLLAVNAMAAPLFSECNSGAPRHQPSGPVPRGPNTFRPASQFTSRPSDVVEVVFRDEAHLPLVLERGLTMTGPFTPVPLME
jgi:hypothetical protein